ncbi:MAG: SIMPL domain-containing protein [Bacteroidota bacterium]
MKRIFFTGLLTLAILGASQLSQAQSIITVVGKAKIEATPDEVGITLSIKENAPAYESAISGLNQRIQNLVKVMLGEGFKKEDIKTMGFNAQPYYEYQNGKRQQRGYTASQNLEVILKYDQERLISIVNAVSKADVEPNMNLGFQLSDELTASSKKQLLEQAMADAKFTASVLAKTQGKVLDGFSEVRYGAVQNAPQPVYRENSMMMKAEADMGNFGGFEAKAIPLSEEVTVVWKVK